MQYLSFRHSAGTETILPHYFAQRINTYSVFLATGQFRYQISGSLCVEKVLSVFLPVNSCLSVAMLRVCWSTNERWRRTCSVCAWLLLLLSHASRVRPCATPWTAAHQAPPSLGVSRQEHWRGVPFPSPTHESEKWKWSRSVMCDS